MNVILLARSLGDGGTEKVLSEISCALPEAIDQTLVLFRPEVVFPHNARLIVLDIGSSSNPVRILINLLKKVYKVKQIAKTAQAEAIISFGDSANYVNILARILTKRAQYRSIASVHSVNSRLTGMTRGFFGFFHRHFIHELYNRADSVFVPSSGVKDDLTTYFGVMKTKIKVIFNPVDIEAAQKKAITMVDHPWFREEMPIIINVARLAWEKNHGDLIRAFAMVRQKRSCRLVIVGEGPKRQELEELTRSLSVEQDVLFTGFQQNPFRYLSKATLFVLSSRMEGLPCALIEAMAVGCPVVSTDCPVGPKEIVAPGIPYSDKTEGVFEAHYGILVPVGEVAAMGEAMLRIIENGTLRKHYAERGRVRAEEFSSSRTIQKLLTLMPHF